MASSSRSPQEYDIPSSSGKVQIVILASEWGSSKGGVSTINRELAIQFAKLPDFEVTFFLPKCSPENKAETLSQFGISIVEAERRPGFEDLEWLSFPPDEMQIDVILGHGVKLGRQAQIIRNSHRCKWVQVIHTDPEELGMFKCYENPISKGAKKHHVEVELCQMADLVVGVGPKLTEAYRRYLSWCKENQDVFEFTPGVFDDFASVQHVSQKRKRCTVLLFGRGDDEDFLLKGFDIAAKSVAALNDTILLFVGAPIEKEDGIAKRFLDFGIPEKRLKVRSFVDSRESLKRLFCEVDLVLMPSRTEGFGLTGLEALSAGLPVVVSKNSGFGEALHSVPFGHFFVIDSEDPNVWTGAIKGIWNRDRQVQLDEARILRDIYGERYNWSAQCKDLCKKMAYRLVNREGSSDKEQMLLQGGVETERNKYCDQDKADSSGKLQISVQEGTERKRRAPNEVKPDSSDKERMLLQGGVGTKRIKFNDQDKAEKGEKRLLEPSVAPSPQKPAREKDKCRDVAELPGGEYERRPQIRLNDNDKNPYEYYNYIDNDVDHFDDVYEDDDDDDDDSDDGEDIDYSFYDSYVDEMDNVDKIDEDSSDDSDSSDDY
ncbi:uncharacterized protein [Acropora muricata]|uniref:uncharacterized protein isoform X2 n=1 Tax=Acropora muricata TaxID=159855 RepID=UPI0034E3C639